LIVPGHSPNPPSNAAVGYSATPLLKKLGIKSQMSIVVLHAPANFTDLLGTLPDGVTVHHSLRAGQRVSLLIGFITERQHLEMNVGRLVASLPPDGILWVAWPKKASKVPTDMSDEVIREVVLPTGWVDTKVCALDATWSGLKFMLRKALRPPTH
jgi:hypothetical protein